MTSAALSPSVLSLGLPDEDGEGLTSLRHPSAADASQSASYPSRKEEKKDWVGKVAPALFLLRQVSKCDGDAETWARVRDARAQHAGGAKMSF